MKDYIGIGSDLAMNIHCYFHSRILEEEHNPTIERYCQEFYNDDELLNIGNEETHGSSSELEDEVIK